MSPDVYGDPLPGDFRIPSATAMRAFRDSVGLSYEQVAARGDVSPSSAAVWRLEHPDEGSSRSAMTDVLSIYEDLGVDHEYRLPTADELSEIRIRTGLSATDVADACSLSRKSVYRAESGDSDTYVETLDEILGVIHDVAGVDDPPPDDDSHAVVVDAPADDWTTTDGDTRVRVDDSPDDGVILRRERYDVVDHESRFVRDDGAEYVRYGWREIESFPVESDAATAGLAGELFGAIIDNDND